MVNTYIKKFLLKQQTHEQNTKVGIGSTWVMFAGFMRGYDLDVFWLH